MYRYQVNCDESCSIVLESEKEVREISSNKAKFSKYIEKEVSKKEEILELEIKKAIEQIQSISILPKKEKVEEEEEEEEVEEVRYRGKTYYISKNNDVLEKIGEEYIILGIRTKKIPLEIKLFEEEKLKSSSSSKKEKVPKKEIPKKEIPKKEIPKKEEDSCLGVERYFYKEYSCYLDSVLFALFSFPNSFVDKHLLNVSDEELNKSLRQNINVRDKTTEDIEVIINYSKKIQTLLRETKEKFTGKRKEKYCVNLRNQLLKSPLNSVSNSTKKNPWSKVQQQDAGELLQSIFNSLFVSTITFSENNIYRNTKDKKIPDFIDNSIQVSQSPFITVNLYGFTNLQNEIRHEIIIPLEFDNEFISEYTAPIKKLNIIKIKKNLSVINSIAVIISQTQRMDLGKFVHHEYDYIFEHLSSGKLEVLSENIENMYGNDYVKFFDNFMLEIKKVINKKLGSSYYDTKLVPEILKRKQDPTKKYYQYHNEFLQNTRYYNQKITNIEYHLDSSVSNNNYLVFHIERFGGGSEKNQKEINLDSDIKIDGQTLYLNHIVAHQGSTVGSGHYIVGFQCKDMWYIYDTLKQDIERIGNYREMVQYDSTFFGKNGTLLFYSGEKQIL